jgi:hypothetical protein
VASLVYVSCGLVGGRGLSGEERKLRWPSVSFGSFQGLVPALGCVAYVKIVSHERAVMLAVKPCI